MGKIAITRPADAYRLLNPGAVPLISVGDGSRDNLFPVTWNMPVRRDPGMVAILCGKAHFSYPIIEQTGEFGMNIPTADMAAAVLGCGRTSGRSVADKFKRFNLSRQPAERIRAPLVTEAPGNLECRVCQVVDLGTSALLIATIIAARADERHFRDGCWCFDHGLQLLHHLGGDRFALLTQELKVSAPAAS